MERITYSQDWSAYNAAQTQEKELFMILLDELCDLVEEPEQKRAGRPSLNLRDMIFCSCLKIYGTLSGRRTISDIDYALRKGHIERKPHFNSIFNFPNKD